MPRGRPRALCRRARRGGAGRGPLPRRGRARARSRSSTGPWPRWSTRVPPPTPRRRCCIRRSAAISSATGASATAIPTPPSLPRRTAIAITIDYPAQRGDADRVPRRPRAVFSRRRRLRGDLELHGALRAPSGDGAGAQGAGEPAPPQDAAGVRRQLRRPAIGLPLCRADERRRAGRRAAGQMDRGPARASRGRDLGDQPRHHARGGGERRRARSRRSAGTSSRIAGPICARRSRRRSIACTAI